MDGKIRATFHWKVLLTSLTLCCALVAAFMVFQYHREKNFRTELLNTRLQMYNSRILDDIERGYDINETVSRIGLPVSELRFTLIDRDGTVIYDNNDSTPFPTANHNDRPEVIAARQNGVGYIVERLSENDGTEYFYSAKLGKNGMVARSAALYTHSLESFLRADTGFLWVMAIVTLAAGLAGYFATRRISTSISRLNDFAARAEKGDHIFDDEAFPRDELGSIASHIVRLYVQRNQQHQEAIRQERDKIRLKKQLTDNINHELKTPVASIAVCAELLRDHPELDSGKRSEFIERILSNARRLASLLSDISTITRMDDGSALINKEPVDVKKVVVGVVGDELLRTDIKITVEMPRIIINGNRSLIESIFRNLIDNAIAYSGASEIRVCADNDGNFTVSDNGRGVPEEHLPLLFERFYRIDKGRSRAVGGTGLGLSIVRNAVAVHGGRITVRNDGGLRFDFRLR